MGKKANYGRGHPAFLKYVDFIANHPSYLGMPDLHNDDGEIQWITPSNRKSGRFKDSHLRRLEWWRGKAKALGIEQTGQWQSEVAKALHPTKKN